MPPKDTAKGPKSAQASAPPEGAASSLAQAAGGGGSKPGAAEKVAADIAAAAANVVVPAFSPKPDCVVEVQQIQDPDNGLKENFKDGFVRHCMSEDGKELRKKIVESF